MGFLAGPIGGALIGGAASIIGGRSQAKATSAANRANIEASERTNLRNYFQNLMAAGLPVGPGSNFNELDPLGARMSVKGGQSLFPFYLQGKDGGLFESETLAPDLRDAYLAQREGAPSYADYQDIVGGYGAAQQGAQDYANSLMTGAEGDVLSDLRAPSWQANLAAMDERAAAEQRALEAERLLPGGVGDVARTGAEGVLGARQTAFDSYGGATEDALARSLGNIGTFRSGASGAIGDAEAAALAAQAPVADARTAGVAALRASQQDALRNTINDINNRASLRGHTGASPGINQLRFMAGLQSGSQAAQQEAAVNLANARAVQQATDQATGRRFNLGLDTGQQELSRRDSAVRMQLALERERANAPLQYQQQLEGIANQQQQRLAGINQGGISRTLATDRDTADRRAANVAEEANIRSGARSAIGQSLTLPYALAQQQARLAGLGNDEFRRQELGRFETMTPLQIGSRQFTFQRDPMTQPVVRNQLGQALGSLGGAYGDYYTNKQQQKRWQTEQDESARRFNKMFDARGRAKDGGQASLNFGQDAWKESM